jgi:hypothetical protein
MVAESCLIAGSMRNFEETSCGECIDPAEDRRYIAASEIRNPAAVHLPETGNAPAQFFGGPCIVDFPTLSNGIYDFPILRENGRTKNELIIPLP